MKSQLSALTGGKTNDPDLGDIDAADARILELEKKAGE